MLFPTLKVIKGGVRPDALSLNSTSTKKEVEEEEVEEEEGNNK